MREMQAGCSKGIYMPDSNHVVLLWSIKFRTMGVPFLADPENESPFKFSDSKLLELGRTRVWEDKVIKWIQAKRIELALPRVKPDGWDLPGGDWTKGEHPFVAMRREFKEETGLAAERIDQFHVRYAKSRSGSGKYGNFYYWVRGVSGKLKTTGTEGEAESPEVVKICDLSLENSYFSQAQVFQLFLHRLVEEFGMREYKASLAHISGLFKDSNCANKASKAFSEKPRDVDRSSRANQGRLVRMPKDIRYEKD